MLNLPVDPIILTLVAGISLLVGLLLGMVLASILGLRERSSSLMHSRDELLRLWKNVGDRHIYLEVDGELFESVDQMKVSQHREVVHILDDLDTWLRTDERPKSDGIMKSHDDKSDDKEHATSVLMRENEVNQQLGSQSDSEIKPHSIEAASDGFTQYPSMELDQGREEFEEPKPRSRGYIQSFMRSFRRREHIESEPQVSIVKQIDMILQEKLGSTDLRDKVIRIETAPDNDLIVVVGDKEYTSADDVPDDEVRKLIRDSVDEWERREDERINPS